MRILSSSSKPLTSPGRTERFPPPLMRFLRSNNVGTSTKGRTKATPMLFLRRRKASSNTVETHEPSSPKVTCIGQVRVRRSKSSTNKTPKINNQNPRKTNCCKSSNNKTPKINNQNPRKSNCCNCCCCWFRKPSICGLKMWKKPRCKKWVWFLNCRSVKVRTDSSKFGSSRFDPEPPAETGTITTESMATHLHSATPPKNALLLTRCRSAPYRTTSLVCKMLDEKAEEEDEEENRALGIVSVSSSRNSRDSASKSRGDQDSESLKKSVGNCAHFERDIVCTINDYYNNNNNGNEGLISIVKNGDEEEEEVFCKPMVLKRCKSEPARRDSEKFDPESSEFWRLRNAVD